MNSRHCGVALFFTKKSFLSSGDRLCQNGDQILSHQNSSSPCKLPKVSGSNSGKTSHGTGSFIPADLIVSTKKEEFVTKSIKFPLNDLVNV